MSVESRGAGIGDPVRNRQNQAATSAGTPPDGYAPGDVISGKYRLLRPIGRGGMGVVWEAHSEPLDIRVAVKLIQQLGTSEEVRQRLLLEARAAARLVDPGVIRIFNCGKTSKGDPYIVMELLEGEDLATRLEQRGRLPPVETVRTLLPIVRALSTAHAATIVHRDVKPENVFLAKSASGEEQPKLFDFGIAKIDLSWEKRLTQAGLTLGSPGYMSPEQALGEEIDARSDLWGICVVIYEAITGSLPFDGQSYQAIIHAILCAEIKSFADLGIQEPELWSIVAKGLTRDREQRWQTSDDLEEALSTWLINREVMHDVTGVSLHATRDRCRVRHMRLHETERPPSLSGHRLRSSRPPMSATVARDSRHGFWSQIPLSVRYFLLMATVAFFGAVIRYTLKRAVTKEQPPAHPAATLVTPKLEESIAVPKAIAPAPSLVSPQTVSESIPIPTSSNVMAQPKGPSQSARTSKPKPKPTRTKSDPFKNPFD